MKQRARGFTMLELVVASTMILAITSVALSIMLTVHFTQVESQIRNATTRDCQLLLDTIGEDLRYLGSGVPYGASVQTSLGARSDPTIQLRPALRVAESQYLAFIGDLPYPNAEFNGMGVVTDFDSAPTPLTSANSFAVSSELSGCVPPATSPGLCNTRLMSPAWGGTGPNACDRNNMGSATCPWALNKWQADASNQVDLIMTSPGGAWALWRWDVATKPNTSTTRGQVMITATAGYPTAGAEQLRRAPFVDARAGPAMVSQLDRVFYSLEQSGSTASCGTSTDCVLKRRQCWGALGLPSFLNFPAAGTPSASVGRSGGNPGNCAAGANADGTRWEPVTGGISALSFRYFDESDVEIPSPITAATDLARVASIEVQVSVRRRARVAFIAGQVKLLTQTMTRRFYLENYGPFVDSFDCDADGTFAGSSNCNFQGRP